MILLVASKADTASVNIANQLPRNHDFHEVPERFHDNPVYSRNLANGHTAKLVFIEKEVIWTQDLKWPPNVNLLIFLSRHSSKSQTPTLSVHTPGNLGDANLGGLKRKISISPASAMKEALMALKKAQEEMNLEYEVSYECTHHGPSLDIPTMLVELGSSPAQWKDTKAAEAAARGALAAASSGRIYPTVLGIGGPHYCGKFTSISLRGETAFGHIVPKYAIGEVDEEILTQCKLRTLEPVRRAVLDWKGIVGAEKRRMMSLVDKAGLEVERV